MKATPTLVDDFFGKQYDYLNKRGIKPDIIERLGLQFCGSGMLADRGIEFRGITKGILWTIRDVDGLDTGAVGARVWYEKGFSAKDYPKFATPRNQVPRLYHSPLCDWSRLEYGQTIVLCESFLKADVASLCGFHAIGVSGVWGWSHKKALIDDFRRIPWKALGLKLVVCFDSNVGPDGNELLNLAVERLGAEMERMDAKAYISYLPKNGSEDWGLDDFYAKHGKQAVVSLLEKHEVVHSGITQHMMVMNRDVAVVRELNKIVDLDNGILMSRYDFINVAYPTRKVWNEEGKAISVAKCWMEWGDRNQVEKIVYRPGQERITDGCFNFWKEMGCTPQEDETYTALWEEWLTTAFPREEERHWVCCWLAAPLQELGLKLTTALVLVGTSGVGKGWLAALLRAIYGLSNSAITDLTALASRFNSDYSMKQLLIVEESELPSWGSDALYTRLKDMITNEVMRMEAKGVNAYTVENRMNVMLQSNRNDLFKLDQFDRRMGVFEVGGANIANNEEFWAPRWAGMDKGLPEAVYHWLLNYELGSFNPQGKAPQTRAREEMIELTHSPREQWIMDLMEDPDSVLMVLGQVVDGGVMTAKELEFVYQGGNVAFMDIDKKLSDAMNSALRKMRMPMARGGNKIKLNGMPTRFFVVRPGGSDDVSARKFWKGVYK